MLRAVATQKAPVLLAASAVTTSVTGTTSETALVTVSIPAGAMGLNGGILVDTSWSVPNTANNKTLRVRLGGTGGTEFLLQTYTTGTVSARDMREIRNRNNAAIQLCSSSSPLGGVGASTSSLVTATVDTSVAVDLVISGQLANSGETLSLSRYAVWLLP